MSESCPEKDIPEKRGGTPNFRKMSKIVKNVKNSPPVGRPAGGGGGTPRGGVRPGRPGGSGGGRGGPPAGGPGLLCQPRVFLTGPATSTMALVTLV